MTEHRRFRDREIAVGMSVTDAVWLDQMRALRASVVDGLIVEATTAALIALCGPLSEPSALEGASDDAA